MRSIKTKLFSLGMAASMLLALGGCAMSTPANVGSIGGVEIPAGVYLLAQYNSYNTAWPTWRPAKPPTMSRPC